MSPFKIFARFTLELFYPSPTCPPPCFFPPLVPPLSETWGLNHCFLNLIGLDWITSCVSLTYNSVFIQVELLWFLNSKYRHLFSSSLWNTVLWSSNLTSSGFPKCSSWNHEHSCLLTNSVIINYSEVKLSNKFLLLLGTVTQCQQCVVEVSHVQWYFQLLSLMANYVYNHNRLLLWVVPC